MEENGQEQPSVSPLDVEKNDSNINDEEDKFEDADTHFQQITSEVIDHKKGMEVIERAIKLMLTNQYYEAEAILKPCADTSLYHSVAYGSIMFLQAMLSFEQEAIEHATTALQTAVTLCSMQRKKTGALESLSAFVFGQKLGTYSEVELQAEVLYAECNMLLSMLTFFQDENLMSFIKGGLRIRQCYSMYKGFHQWVETARAEGTEIDPDFEAGVSLGVGVFNLVISRLPPRILKLLEFVGFSGDGQVGLKELSRVAKGQSFRSPMAATFLLFYYTVASVMLGLVQEFQVSRSEELLQQQMSKYPNSMLFQYFRGRNLLIRGNIDQAIEWFSLALKAQDQWKQVHHLCWWELKWCYCFKGQWATAAHYADKLFQDSKWSKATFLYQKAVFQLMLRHKMYLPPQLDEDAKPPTDKELSDMMKAVPPFKQRIAGKSIPVEKFVIAKSERQLTGAHLPLSGLEMIYAWNGFQLLAKNRELLEGVMRVVWDERMNTEETRESNDNYIDDWAVVCLIQGVCFKGMERYEEAEVCFQSIIDRSEELQHDHYTVPAASMELGLLRLDQGNTEEAKKILEFTKTSYKGYHMESRIHFRIHAGLSRITQLTHSNLESS